MAVLLNLGTVIAVGFEQSGIGSGKATWADTDVVAFNDDSGLTPAVESLTRNLMTSSFIACKSISGQETTSGNLNTEIAVQAVIGTEAGKLKGHALWEAGLGIYVEQGADCSVPFKISEEADPVANPTGYDLYKLSKPDDIRKTLCVREYLGGTANVLESVGVVVDSIALSLSAGQIATASIAVSAIGFNTPTGQTVLANLGCGSNPFVTKNAIFRFGGISIPAQDVSITINSSNVDRMGITGSGITDKVTVAKSIEISYSLDMEDLSHYQTLKNNTDAELFIELANGAEQMKIYLPRVSYTSVDKSSDGGVITVSISAMAIEDGTSKEALFIATKKA